MTTVAIVNASLSLEFTGLYSVVQYNTSLSIVLRKQVRFYKKSTSIILVVEEEMEEGGAAPSRLTLQ